MSVFTLFFRCFGCKFGIYQLCFKTKIHGLDHFHGNGPYCKIPTEKEPIRAQGFAEDWVCHIIIIINKIMLFYELNFSPSGSGRTFYSDEEDLALIKFVKENKFLYSIKGNNLYKEAEKAKV